MKKHSHGKYVMLVFSDGTRVLEHRYVMARHIGRKLHSDEVVHHRNGDGKDNRLRNLRLWSSNSEHTQHHARERSRSVTCMTCGRSFVLSLGEYTRRKRRVKHGLYCSRSCAARSPYTRRAESKIGDYIQLCKDLPGISINEAASILRVCRRTICNWRRRLKNN